jgi:hypothetical protein
MKNQDESNTHEKQKGNQTSFHADCHGKFHPEFVLPAPSMLLALSLHIKSSHVGMRKGKSCELKASFLKWYPISLSLHSYTKIGDETGIGGVELRSKDRVTLHLNLLPSNNWCYPICIYVFEFPANHSSCRPISLPSNFQAENASGCIFSCWVLEHQAPVFAKNHGHRRDLYYHYI